MSSPRCRMLGRLVQHHFAPVGPVHLGDLRAQLALEPLHASSHAAELILQPQDVLDAGEIQTELRRQSVNEAQALQIALGVEPRTTGRAARLYEPLRLVHPQRLGVHADEVGGNGDHVPRALGHQRSIPSPPSSLAVPYATTARPSGTPTICGQPPAPTASSTALKPT